MLDEDALDLGGLQLNFDFLEMDDPYYDKDALEVDTQKLFDLHKQEVVKQNVEFRVPPPVDKKSLHHRYETLSMKVSAHLHISICRYQSIRLLLP